VRENIAHGKHLTLYRTITTGLGEDSICIRDQVVNESTAAAEHMLLYHFNFGYPLIGEHCSVNIPPGPKRWIDGSGQTDQSHTYPQPAERGIPSVLLHEDVASADGTVSIGISNRIVHNGQEKKLSVTLTYVKDQCPYLTQWKHPAKGVYVMGIEPGNASTEGRSIQRERGALVVLQPGESHEYRMNLSFRLEEG
jgi:hypothetical protein